MLRTGFSTTGILNEKLMAFDSSICFTMLFFLGPTFLVLLPDGFRGTIGVTSVLLLHPVRGGLGVARDLNGVPSVVFKVCRAVLKLFCSVIFRVAARGGRVVIEPEVLVLGVRSGRDFFLSEDRGRRGITTVETATRGMTVGSEIARLTTVFLRGAAGIEVRVGILRASCLAALFLETVVDGTLDPG